MATSRAEHFDPYEGDSGLYRPAMTPRPPFQGLPSSGCFLPGLVFEWKLNVLFVGAALVGRPSCWVVCIFNVHPGQCQCHQWKANLTRVTPSSVLFPHVEALIRATSLEGDIDKLVTSDSWTVESQNQ